MRAYALMVLLVVTGGVPALAQDNPACAKFQEPLAYNACLARQGPPARMAREAPAPRAAADGRWRFHGRPAYFHARGGRAHAIFSVR